MADSKGRSPPPARDDGQLEERRFLLRRLTVRRRRERPGCPDRRVFERRRSATRLMAVPSRASLITPGLML